MKYLGHITPYWNIEDFKSLEYKRAEYRGAELIKQYLDAGHHRESVELYNYFEPNPMPDSVYQHIVPHFNYLENVGVAVNLFKPGQFVPCHSDRYDRYKELHGLKSIEPIVRYVVMLEDGIPGQIMEIDKELYSYWRAGDVFGWSNTISHAFYNFSTQDRYAKQITGVLQ